MKSVTRLLVAIVFVMAISLHFRVASAAQVRANYVGLIKTVTGNPFGLTVPLDTPISGYFQYDTSTADSATSVSTGEHEHTGGGGFLATFMGQTVTGSATPWVQVVQESTLRIWDGSHVGSRQGGTMSFNGGASNDISLFFVAVPQGVNKALLPSDALPNPFPNFPFVPLINDTPHTFSLGDEQGGMLIQLSSITPIPEPASATLFVLGVLSIYRLKRRNRR